MTPHLFLTGNSGVGKSTLIEKTLGNKLAYAGGFLTRREMVDGAPVFRLMPPAAVQFPEGFELPIFLDYRVSPPQQSNEVFREAGVTMLQEASCYPFAVLDEFGGFELLLPQFRMALLELLSSELPILGVLKGEQSVRKLQERFGFGERFPTLADSLRSALSQRLDCTIIEMQSPEDMQAQRAVAEWFRQYAE